MPAGFIHFAVIRGNHCRKRLDRALEGVTRPQYLQRGPKENCEIQS